MLPGLFFLVGILGLNQATGNFVCFQDCLCTQNAITCRRLGLTRFPEIHKKVRFVDVSGNDISDIGILPRSYISDLNLSNNSIQFFWPEAFSKLNSLRRLDLSYNRIVDFHLIAPISVNSRILYFLNVSHNPLERLDFIPLSNLRSLDLSFCKLTHISPHNLMGLPNLQNLNISGNPIKMLRNLSLPSLVELQASKTPITHLAPDFFLSLPSLVVLDLSHSINLKAWSVPQGTSLPSLQVLDLSYCNIAMVNLDGLARLTQLFLKENRIHEVYDVMFVQNPDLFVLDLSGNTIRRVSIHYNSLLHSLDLSRNSIKELDENFFGSTPYLRYLNISFNRLESLHITSNTLEELDASSCLLREFSGYSHSLRRLVLSHNHLERINGSFSNVKQVDLSFNRIKDMSVLECFPTLAESNLQDNHLSILREDLVKGDVRLARNPWYCDCSRTRPSVDLICASPLNVTGLPWPSACPLVEKKRETWLAPVVAVSITLTLLVIICYSKIKVNSFSQARNSLTPPPSPYQQRHPIARNGARQEEQQPVAEPAEVPDSSTHGLPSYQEALLLPKPEKLRNAQSQTELQRRHSTTSV